MIKGIYRLRVIRCGSWCVVVNHQSFKPKPVKLAQNATLLTIGLSLSLKLVHCVKNLFHRLRKNNFNTLSGRVSTNVTRRNK